MHKTGSCLCGSVQYEVRGHLRPVVFCHCAQCRKSSGHHVAATSANRNTIRISGEVQWYRSSATARRGFCPTCGSNLFWDGLGENMSIMAGTLDNTEGLKAVGHIFVADKADYVDLSDGLPQAAQADSKLTTKVKP